MPRMLDRFWNDDDGAIISVELVLILGVLVFGIIPGLVALRNSVIAALTNIGNAISGVVINVGVEDIGVRQAALGMNIIAYSGGFQINQTATQQLSTIAQPPGPNGVVVLTAAPPAPPTGFGGLLP